VLRHVCEDFWRWPEMRVTVNISPVQLRDPNFAADVQELLARHGIAPSSFELELTEGILVNNPTIAKRKLAALKDLGFGLSLDDFGTGFSSIGYLRQFPFDRLKLDRSFVREIGFNPTANALIQAVVSLGDAMDLAVVAEGIENPEQLTLLRLVQCEFIQGFYISPPVTADIMSEMLRGAGPDRRMQIRTPQRGSDMLAAAG
jgi:EAL domain-containing protein (putative c-di-GMP-specific phosphodiesterase class I)